MAVHGSIVVTQCVGPAPIVLLSAESGSWPRGPLCFMGPHGTPYFMALPHSPWGGGAPKEGLQGAHRPAPILSTSLSLNAIFQDLFEVFTKTSLKRIIFLLKHSSKYSPKNIGEYFEKFEGVLFS